ncbi:hypothetical protein CDL12_09188 [Handroanthus impetiginosus]|uniref:Beta-glucosidase n=1 Tax=Handroanthus impetiginosus TaxID=429701 RepID=A0A2G9HKU8_9LAMI|nr:hypothetical protein CDL12_09188 [Handroanthus impetiginosus]
MKETKVKGYFVWSWCDNFEWKDGYTFRFGIIYIDYQNNLTRYLKDSAMWFSKFLAAKDEKEKEEQKQGGDGDDDDDEKEGEEDEQDDDDNDDDDDDDDDDEKVGKN